MPANTRIRQAINSVGMILVRKNSDDKSQPPRPRGSAIVIRKDGIIATNYHVITEDFSEKTYDEILFLLSSQQEPYILKPILINKEKDLVLLRIIFSDKNSLPSFPTIELGDANQLDLLDELIIVGFPEKGGSSVTVNKGIVEGKNTLEGWIKTDARLMYGNSGGAALDNNGRLVGIPTRVVVDNKPGDKEKPNTEIWYGGIGLLRPVNLLVGMLTQLDDTPLNTSFLLGEKKKDILTDSSTNSAKTLLTIRGLIKSLSNGKPITGARVGIIPLGSEDVTATNLLAWGGSNAEGAFELNKPIPPGYYTLKVKAIGYASFSRDIKLSGNETDLIVELRALE